MQTVGVLNGELGRRGGALSMKHVARWSKKRPIGIWGDICDTSGIIWQNKDQRDNPWFVWPQIAISNFYLSLDIFGGLQVGSVEVIPQLPSGHLLVTCWLSHPLRLPTCYYITPGRPVGQLSRRETRGRMVTSYEATGRRWPSFACVRTAATLETERQAEREREREREGREYYLTE